MRDNYTIGDADWMRLKYRMDCELMRDRIREALAAAGLTANQASLALGWDRGYVGKLGTVQNGKIPEPGALKLKLLAQLLGVPSGWLVDAIDPTGDERKKGVCWQSEPAGAPLQELLRLYGSAAEQAQIGGNLVQKEPDDLLMDIWGTLSRPTKSATLLVIAAISGAAKQSAHVDDIAHQTDTSEQAGSKARRKRA